MLIVLSYFWVIWKEEKSIIFCENFIDVILQFVCVCEQRIYLKYLSKEKFLLENRNARFFARTQKAK